MKAVKISLNFRGNSGVGVKLSPLQAQLRWSGGRSNLTIEIVGVPDDVPPTEVLSLFHDTSIIPDYEALKYRLPYDRLGHGKVVFFRQEKEVIAEIERIMNTAAEACAPDGQ